MNITKNRNIWFAVSGALVALSLTLVVTIGFNPGLDFLGGIRWTVHLQNEAIPETPSIEAVKKFFQVQKDEKARLQKSPKIQSTKDGDFLVTIENVSDEVLEAIKTDLSTEYKAEHKSFRRVDPSIGQSFKEKAVYAIIASLIGIIVFVAWAFRKIPRAVSPWRFGAVAIVALFHDVLLILGVFTVLGVLFEVELDLQFITALLATLGFSVNDTIVILDRVRENLRLHKKGETFADTIEKSIQQTIGRSINTSLSTLLPLLALLFFGAESIFYFILALTIAIFIGTYSSIFLAAPLLVTWKKFAEK